MPTFKQRKSSKGLFSEDELKQVLVVIRSGVFIIRKAAIKYNVNRFILKDTTKSLVIELKNNQ